MRSLGTTALGVDPRRERYTPWTSAAEKRVLADYGTPALSCPPMRQWMFPLVLLIVAAFASWQAVESDSALAETIEVQAEEPTTPPSATPLLSVRRAPEWLREPLLIDNLEDALDELAQTFPSQSCLAVSIDGSTVYSHNPTLPLVPASAQKILTAYGVYEILGADYTYETSVVSDAPIVDGVVDGDIYIIGGGDPLLATSGYTSRYEQQPHFRTAIEQLADAVVAAGITEINGGVVGDEERYDDIRYIPFWPERFTNVSQNQTGPLSALTVNDGFVNFAANPAPSLSTATTAPATFAASFFDDLLEERGVIIRGASGEAVAPANATSIASIVSDPVVTVTNQMLDVSDNMAAELLLKEIGFVASRVGSSEGGAIALENLLQEQGFSIAETDVADGSGLATQNRVTCQLLVEVLEASADTPLYDGLAVAGESGTLRERLAGTPAQGAVAAKTGRLNEVGALAGTAIASNGTEITFAWVANTTDLYPVEEMVATQDAIALELVDFPEGPSVEAFAPTQ